MDFKNITQLPGPQWIWILFCYYYYGQAQQKTFLYISIESVYVQQITVYEQHYKANGQLPQKDFCPRIEAIKCLDELISTLQQQQHGIILMLDANQTYQECTSMSSIKPHSIKWLRIRHGMDDPFRQLLDSRPYSTTQTCDIDWVLTYGISSQAISTLTLNKPAISDHLGIIIDFNLEEYFSTTFSAMAAMPSRNLTSGNKKTVDSYLNYVHAQIEYHKIWQRTMDLLEIADNNPNAFQDPHKNSLNQLDIQVTEILLAGEKQC